MQNKKLGPWRKKLFVSKSYLLHEKNDFPSLLSWVEISTFHYLIVNILFEVILLLVEVWKICLKNYFSSVYTVKNCVIDCFYTN